MTTAPGAFIWYELLTSDVAGAAAFYKAVVGWTARTGAELDGYHLFSTGRTEVAGLMACPEGMERPAWLGYLGVEDVDAKVAAVTAAGGACHVPPTDIPNIGRFALLADPQGVPFYVMRPLDAGEESRAFDPMAAGHCRWNELTTTDPKAAFAFYGKEFGWKKDGGMPMGEMGEYEFISHAGVMIGAVMPLQPGTPAAHYTYYFGVPDIDAAAAAITANGGQVLFGPMEIPGDEYAGVALDPQGALFGIVGPRKA